MAFRLPGAGGGSFPLYGGTFARSYSVPRKVFFCGDVAHNRLQKSAKAPQISMTLIVFFLFEFQEWKNWPGPG